MPNYDSESSDEDMDYTTTDVLLGYASKEPTEDGISQLGGQASWLDPSNPPSSDLARCKICHDIMVLLLQLHADLPEHFPGHERRLYVFACRRRTCKRKEGSIRALRSTRVSPTSAQKVEKKKPAAATRSDQQSVPFMNLGNDLFGATKPTSLSASANPFATSSFSNQPKPFSSPSSNLFSSKPAASTVEKEPAASPSAVQQDLPATFAEKARISAPSMAESSPPPTPWPSQLPNPYPAYYLDAAYETLDVPPPEPSSSAAGIPALDDSPQTTGSSGGGGKDKEDADAFESSLDKTFQRFADRLAQNPEQILRYEFRGTPLLYSKTDATGARLAPHQHQHQQRGKITVAPSQRSVSSAMPPCPNCSAQRVFELQLVPQAIAELEAEETALEEGMEWGTIIVGVCSRDCEARGAHVGAAGYVEEWVGVQWEEMR